METPRNWNWGKEVVKLVVRINMDAKMVNMSPREKLTGF